MREATETSGRAVAQTRRSYPPIDVLMPAHNEASSIAQTLREFYEVVHGDLGFDTRFIVAEDGSIDETAEVVRGVARDLPIQLLTFAERKGYSRAVVDALRHASGDLVCFVDSDGQCDPRDLAGLLDRIDGADLVVGYRHPRRDPPFRILISGAFKMLYRRLFPVRLRDPSCPYIVIRQRALGQVLRGSPGILKQGFWWEFNARAAAAHLRVAQVPVRHRERIAGQTQVYRLRKIPRIAYEHVLGLFALRRELDQLTDG